LKEDTSTTGQAKEAGNWLDRLGRKSTPIAGELPLIGKLIKSGGALFFATVRDQIVCVDDLERRGSGLAVGCARADQLPEEQRGCKVALLLSEDRHWTTTGALFTATKM
jgi:hypothetical protein